MCTGEHVVADAESVERADPEVLDDHVGRGDQRAEGGRPRRRLQIERDAPLVAIEAEEARTIGAAGREGAESPGVVASGR